MTESLAERFDRQRQEAHKAVTEATPDAVFISSPGKFMLAVEPTASSAPELLVSLFEWGDARDEVVLTREDVARLTAALADWLDDHPTT